MPSSFQYDTCWGTHTGDDGGSRLAVDQTNSCMYVDLRKEKKKKTRNACVNFTAVSVPVSLENFYLRATLDSDGFFGQFANHRGLEGRAPLRVQRWRVASGLPAPSKLLLPQSQLQVRRSRAGFPAAESRSQRNKGRGALRIRRHDRHELALG